MVLEKDTSFYRHTVDGRNPANQLRLIVKVGSLSHYLQGFFTSQVVIAGLLKSGGPTPAMQELAGLIKGLWKPIIVPEGSLSKAGDRLVPRLALAP